MLESGLTFKATQIFLNFDSHGNADKHWLKQIAAEPNGEELKANSISISETLFLTGCRFFA